jgi:molybdopterin converting factor subunit 1
MPDATPDLTTITVHVLFFSMLREETDTHELDVSLDAPATGNDLLDRLEEDFPAVSDHRSSLRLAVNQAYSPTDAPLRDGDEVALITPVSGG